ncbi:hypothetical protein CERSUDRAFT_100910 [Gelatoporia subvermispora B]|uniref:Heterokaryon incompatibility domain-containing protein n=1 Tax=Ceriporiopsis subvermispora (strain B) TaxID=914234 RepID=M2Q218_CERS8|nr:hypothetical protein CERSUDRAFT_100910 [Gelatoporia subvermispora B]
MEHSRSASQVTAWSSQTSGTATFSTRPIEWLGGNHDGYPLCTFEDYPNLRYSASQLQLFERAPTLQYAALLQSQLVFGFLEAVTGQKLQEDGLLEHTPNGHTIIAVGKIRNAIDHWLYRSLHTETTSNEEAIQVFISACTATRAARALLLAITISTSSVFHEAGVPSNDALCMIYTFATIGEAICAALELFDVPVTNPCHNLDWSFVLVRYDGYVAEMVSDGWCPFTVSMLSKTVTLLGYASTCRSFIIERVKPDVHERCSEHACVINTIEITTYKNRHVVDSCTCAYSKPPLDDVLGIFRRDQIPVVHMTSTGSHGDEVIDMICSSASADIPTPNVAISHVWSDGLGSTTEDGLPSCQIRRLAKLVQDILPHAAIWIDSLCVPKDEMMRRRAIGLMGQTYRRADIVLVIDSGIRSCTTRAPLKQKQLWVYTSAWMQRLWTLQEAVLADTLLFELSGGFVAVEGLLPTSPFEMLDPALGSLSALMYRLLLRKDAEVDLESGLPKIRLGHVPNCLEWRTTSRAEDETLGISSLVHVDAYELVNLPPQRRMMTLLLRVGKVPSMVAFMTSPKLDILGFRWAPRSFMNLGRVEGGESDAKVTPEGLHAVYHVITFNKITLRHNEHWSLHNDEDSRHIVYRLKYVPRYWESESLDEEHYTCNAILCRGQEVQQLDRGIAVLIDDNTQRVSYGGEAREKSGKMLEAEKSNMYCTVVDATFY